MIMMMKIVVKMKIMQVSKLFFVPLRGPQELSCMEYFDDIETKNRLCLFAISSKCYLHPNQPNANESIMRGWPCTGYDGSSSTVHIQPSRRLWCTHLAYVFGFGVMQETTKNPSCVVACYLGRY